ncbi:hypothetical protein LTS01_026016, partial [Friedmanniomyces endolithicus]
HPTRTGRRHRQLRPGHVQLLLQLVPAPGLAGLPPPDRRRGPRVLRRRLLPRGGAGRGRGDLRQSAGGQGLVVHGRVIGAELHAAARGGDDGAEA